MSTSSRRRSSILREVSDLYGRKCLIQVCAHGLTGSSCPFQDFAAPDAPDPGNEPAREQLLAEIWASVLDTYNGWVSSGQLTLTQLRTIRALLLEGRSLREFARQEGVKPAAISCRIESVRFKAPQFYEWWATTHRSRRYPHAR